VGAPVVELLFFLYPLVIKFKLYNETVNGYRKIYEEMDRDIEMLATLGV
jgi:hypothetical protein